MRVQVYFQQDRKIQSKSRPHRPNAIGLSLVHLEKIEYKNKQIQIYISSKRKNNAEDIDIVDGTIVLDIKPYLSKFESIPTSKYPSYL